MAFSNWSDSQMYWCSAAESRSHLGFAPSFPPEKTVITATMTDFRSARIIEKMVIRIIGPAFRAA
jgi:hypothetical protein